MKFILKCSVYATFDREYMQSRFAEFSERAKLRDEKFIDKISTFLRSNIGENYYAVLDFAANEKFTEREHAEMAKELRSFDLSKEDAKVVNDSIEYLQNTETATDALQKAFSKMSNSCKDIVINKNPS